MKLINIRPREGGGGVEVFFFFAREEMVQRWMQNFLEFLVYWFKRVKDSTT